MIKTPKEDRRLEDMLTKQIYAERKKVKEKQSFSKNLGDFLFYSGKHFIDVVSMIYRIPTVSRSAGDIAKIELECVCDSSASISENTERVKEKERIIYEGNNPGRAVGSILGIPVAALSTMYLTINQNPTEINYYGVGAIVLTNVLSYLYEHRKKEMRSKPEQQKSLRERMVKSAERGWSPWKKIYVDGGIAGGDLI